MIMSIRSTLPFSAVEGNAHACVVLKYLQSTQYYQVARYFGTSTLH